MRAEPVANALGPAGFLAAVWLGIFLKSPEGPLYWRGALVGAGMWAVGWCAGRAGRAVLRDAAERIRAREETEKKAATEAAVAAGVPSGPSAAGVTAPATPATAARRP